MKFHFQMKKNKQLPEDFQEATCLSNEQVERKCYVLEIEDDKDFIVFANLVRKNEKVFLQWAVLDGDILVSVGYNNSSNLNGKEHKFTAQQEAYAKVIEKHRKK